MDRFTKIGISIAFIMFCFFMYMFYREVKNIKNEKRTKCVWLNKEHTAWHYQDTLEINNIKYIKVYDRNNSGYYGSPYLVEVK